MTRSFAVLAFVAAFLAACTGSGAPLTPTVSPSEPAAKTSPATTEGPATPASPAAVVPPGRILFYRIGSDGLEHYFTVNTHGTDEHALFTTDGCGCARFSPDGTSILTMGATGHGTWSLMTLRPDGSHRVVLNPPIETLTLAQPVSNVGYERIAFSAWDDTDSSRAGLYIANPDLSDLRHVLRQPDGVVDMEPVGVTPDGSQIVFFSDTGPSGGMNHAGDLYVISSKGTNLRKLNSPDSKVGFHDLPTASLSPDGHQAAFAMDDAVYVVDVDSGVGHPITARTGFAWAVSWSPTGEWLSFTRQYGDVSVVSLVRPDGSDLREISTRDALDESSAAVWSPDGRHLLVRRGVDEGTHGLWIMDTQGTFIARVTDDALKYGNYGWGSSGTPG